MLLATSLKDFTAEDWGELIGTFVPLLGLLAIFIVVPLVLFIYNKTVQRNPKLNGLFSYMDEKGLDVLAKTKRLGNFLASGSSSIKLIRGVRTCPICGKTYPVKRKVQNARGDMEEEWSLACPRCNTQLGYQDDEYVLERTPTKSDREKQYQEDFDRLNSLIAYYHPIIEGGGSDDDNNGNITININIR
jgi:uncharacterized protein YbaR (Trm112 family)